MLKNNTQEVNKIITTTLLVCSLAFVALLLFDYLHVFGFDEKLRFVMRYFGLFCTISPFVVRKFNAPEEFVKYYTLLVLGVLIGVLGTFTSIGVYITYILVPVISCLYFDRKLTINCGIFSYLAMVFGVWVNTMSRWEIVYKGIFFPSSVKLKSTSEEIFSFSWTFVRIFSISLDKLELN